jgi:hypothetical protein
VATYHGLIIPGLDVTAGVYNLFGQEYRNLLPLGGFVHPGMPAMQREFGIRLAYQDSAQTTTP